MKTLAKVVLAATAALALPAFAQETIGTLTVNSGTVMTSNGGEFATAGTGEAIQVGEQTPPPLVVHGAPVVRIHQAEVP